MARRITIPVKGGLYKSVKVDTQQSAGTTISGFDNQIITLDQLRAALGLTNKASVTPPSGGGTSGSLIVAPGLVGGGPLVGTVPLRINKAQAAAMFVGGGGDDDGGGSGPPGRKGPQGPIGANGPAGTPGGPRGHVVLIQPEDPELPIVIRGPRGLVTYANPTASLGLTANNGIATTGMRSDASPALSQAIGPTWTGSHTFTPTSGQGIVVNANTGVPGVILNGGANTVFHYVARIVASASASAGCAPGLQIQAGTNSSDAALAVVDVTAAKNFFEVFGDGTCRIGYNGTANPTILTGTAGQVQFPMYGAGVLTSDASGNITAGPATTLSAAILADSPFAFWKCDDASTSLADSSGNGFNLTTVLGVPAYQDGPLVPSLPTTKFVNLGGYSSAASAVGFSLASSLGQTLPLTQWTAEFIVSQFSVSSGVSRMIDWRTSSTGAIVAVYNNAGILSVALNGTNVPLGTGANLVAGKPTHVVVVCTTSAGTSTFVVYLNGMKVGGTTSAASTSSGGIPTIGVGDYTFGGATSGETVGYIALYTSALSVPRIVAHAQAAGLFGL